jgi:hypothetical protein
MVIVDTTKVFLMFVRMNPPSMRSSGQDDRSRGIYRGIRELRSKVRPSEGDLRLRTAEGGLPQGDLGARSRKLASLA